METNRKLKIASVFFKIVCVLFIVIPLSIIFIVVDSTYHPERYNKVTVSKTGGVLYSNLTPDSPVFYDDWKETTKDIYYLNRLSFQNKVWITIINVVPSVILVLCVICLIKYLQSINNYNSFFTKGTYFISKIKIYLFIILAYYVLSYLTGIRLEMFLLKSSNAPDYYGVTHWQRVLNISPFITVCAVIIICYISELILKEGERLRNENELTV